ncbi:MAG: hypothetical protein ABF690_15370 [Liquorilactobacillus nagelii]|uniref:hypothetical protein n=1 Tax=Liquorilactobacillus satsumensis TaxID=259059 RepID=UPI00345D1D4A
MKYKKNDKVLILCTVDYGEEGFTVLKESPLEGPNILGKLEDFQPKEEKIKFTPEIKKEFDSIYNSCFILYSAMTRIYRNPRNFPNLYHFLFCCETGMEQAQNQRTFSNAMFSYSLVETAQPEKHTVKVGEECLYFAQDQDQEKVFGFAYDSDDFKLTLDEVKEAEKKLGVQGLQAKWYEASEKDE